MTQIEEKDLATARAILGVMPVLMRLITTKAREHGTVSPERAKVLVRLSGGAMRSGELAHQCMLTPPAVTELVEGLARDGLVRREEDKTDRRVVVVALTSPGRREVERYQNALAEALGEAVTRLDPLERERLLLAFTDLRRAIEGIAAPASKEQREMSHVR